MKYITIARARKISNNLLNELRNDNQCRSFIGNIPGHIIHSKGVMDFIDEQRREKCKKLAEYFLLIGLVFDIRQQISTSNSKIQDMGDSVDSLLTTQKRVNMELELLDSISELTPKDEHTLYLMHKHVGDKSEKTVSTPFVTIPEEYVESVKQNIIAKKRQLIEIEDRLTQINSSNKIEISDETYEIFQQRGLI